jgi:CheY-like chemotaxis protein
MTGLELITDELKAVDLVVDGLPPSPAVASLQNSMTSILATSEHIQQVNSFMWMAINRCLDWTKSLNGFKLSPKLESIDLQETLSLPIDCISSSQSKIDVRLLPYEDLDGEAICPFVITDKQWLQENLLCLLSNAVKYSSQGLTTVTIRLQSFPPTDDHVALQEVQGRDEESHGTEIKIKESPSLLSRINPFPCIQRTLHQQQHQQRTNKIVPSSLLVQYEQQQQRRDLESPSISLSHHIVAGLRVNPNGIERDRSEENVFLVVEVEDTGIGMTDEDRAALFSPFHQNQRLAGGTGLGLFSLAKRMEALHGRFGVRGRRDGGQGSLFWFAIPYKPDRMMEQLHQSVSIDLDGMSTQLRQHFLRPETPRQHMKLRAVADDSPVSNHQTHSEKQTERVRMTAEPRPANSSLPAAQTSTTATSTGASSSNNSNSPGGSRILLVDDSPSILKLMSRVLERQGHQVTSVENGALAVDLVKGTMPTPAEDRADDEATEFLGGATRPQPSRRFDVVLMDLHMPVMDGLEATQRIRELERQHNERHRRQLHQLIVCVTANSDVEFEAVARQAGADDFLPKPFSVEAFLSIMERLKQQQFPQQQRRVHFPAAQ